MGCTSRRKAGRAEYRDDLAQTVKVGNKPILQNNKVVGIDRATVTLTIC
jgi:hypothetical protein